MFEILEKLEYEILDLPKPDITLFLYMPTSAAKILKQNREEKPDLDMGDPDPNYKKEEIGEKTNAKNENRA